MDNEQKQTAAEAFAELNARAEELALLLLEPLEPLVIETNKAILRFASWYRQHLPKH